MTVLLLILLLLIAGIYIFMQQPKFGKLPSGKRLERIKKSPNYKDGSFKNLSVTPNFKEGVTYFQVLKEFLFNNTLNMTPAKAFHFEKTDLKNLNPNEDVYVWMGHSSYYLQIDGKKILVDPVFSGSASPIPITTPAFDGTDLYTVDDIPELDLLIITHDHWDHLDFETVVQLQPKVKKVLTGLGTGEHLEFWKYPTQKIIELDWNEKAQIMDNFTVYCTPARHFSGRTFTRDQAIWASFVLQTQNSKVYIGGDSGYDTHFSSIGNQFGPFDVAISENGQYDWKWQYIHLLPEEFLKAGKDLQAKTIIPVHNSKFKLSTHSWNAPLQKISEYNSQEKLHLITPKIGEKVSWKDTVKVYEKWWEKE